MDEIVQCCANCIYWQKHDVRTERPFWGLCTATEKKLIQYIRPVPDKLETVAPFYCAAFVLHLRKGALRQRSSNAAVALGLTLLTSVGLLTSMEKIDAAFAVFVALEAAATGASAIGPAKRRESGWLFWPVWLWNFVMVYGLVRLRFFFRLYF